jgi:hypothetical protein
MEDHDFVLQYLRDHNLKLTRENYIEIAFLGGDVPDDLDFQLPEGLVDDFPLTQQDSAFLKTIGIVAEE